MPEISKEVRNLGTYEPGEDSFVPQMREAYVKARPEICIERPQYVTAYHQQHDLFKDGRITILEKAKCWRYLLENKKPIVRHQLIRTQNMEPLTIQDRSPFAGSTTRKFKGVILYPELVGLIMWPELLTVSRRKQNPFFITRSDIDELNSRIFPYWMDKNVVELTRSRYYNRNEELDDLQLEFQFAFYLDSKPLCISHTIPDFSRAIEEGLEAMAAKAREEVEKAKSGSDQWLFYSALVEVFEGIMCYADKLAEEADFLEDSEPEKKEKDRLREIAETYKRVPRNKAQTFREALTTIWLCWTALNLENADVGLSLGRLDQVLYPLYRQDVIAKRLTPQQAVDLVCHLWLKIGDHVPTMNEAGERLFGGTGANQAITVGGVDKDGADAVNDLTYVILRATEFMKLRDPNLNARYHPGVNQPEYLQRICEVNVNTGATPAIHNDIPVIKALTAEHEKDGFSLEESKQYAREYGIVGCVEPVSAGRTYGHNAAILLNLTSVLELTLYSGRHRRTGLGLKAPRIGPKTPNPAQMSDFNNFRAAFEDQLRHLMDRARMLNDNYGKIHQRYYPTPIMSAFFKGPWKAGKDVVQGGALINSSGVSLIGLADTADSLSALEKHVFTGSPLMDVQTLFKALEENFDEHEALHGTLINPTKTPKFGNEDPAGDDNLKWLLEKVNDALAGHINYRGGRYRVGCWTMTIHTGIGRLTGALPNGRKKGEPFASGIAPVSLLQPRLELLRTLHSAADIPPRHISSGIALNLKFTPGSGTPEKKAKTLAWLVEGCFDRDDGKREGAMEVQFNIRTREEYEYAKKHPEKCPDLLVRVSGYTAFFTDLNAQMQDEIIDRNEYVLSEEEMPYYEPVQLRD